MSKKTKLGESLPADRKVTEMSVFALAVLTVVCLIVTAAVLISTEAAENAQDFKIGKLVRVSGDIALLKERISELEWLAVYEQGMELGNETRRYR